jgi:DNA-binding response OmpR family regulator
MGKPLGRVMIVDDDIHLQRVLDRRASRVELVALAILDGKNAMETALAERPDLILLDMSMPSADGRDILSSLKRDDRTSWIPVFIHSGSATDDERRVAFDLGADDYFEKGYDTTMLFRRIVDTIEKASSGTYLARRVAGKVNEGGG